jgi:hypothetical protein
MVAGNLVDGRTKCDHDDKDDASIAPPLRRHPGLEPGSIWQTHERFRDGPRLKAGVTEGEGNGGEAMLEANSWMVAPNATMTLLTQRHL